jgi:hypothetical protein
MTKPTKDEEHIRTAAYYLWLEEGQPEGQHLEHWERAHERLAVPPKRAARKAASAGGKTAAKPRARRAAPSDKG